MLQYLARALVAALYFGRLEYRKGVLTLAEAVARFPGTAGPAEFTFIGHDTRWRGRSVRELMAERLQAAAPSTAYRFLPALAWPALRREIDRSDLVVLPSRYENFAYSCLEAMARGKPVLACGGSGFDELIIPGDTGHLAAPDDPPALAAALVGILADRDWMVHCGRRARMAVTDFLPEVVVPRLMDTYAVLRERCPRWRCHASGVRGGRRHPTGTAGPGHQR